MQNISYLATFRMLLERRYKQIIAMIVLLKAKL
jgi:hypothetical protein